MTPNHRLSLAALAALLLAGCAAAPEKISPCSRYCASQAEGYEWAQRANLLDARACEGYAADFVRGCKDAVRDYSQSKSPREGW